MTTAAVLSPVVLVGAALRVDFPTMVAQGQRGILIVKSSNGGLLDASLLSNVSIRIFRSTSATPGTAVQTIPINDNSVAIALLPGNSDINQVSFQAAQPFDQMELQISGLLAAGTDMSVFAAYATVAPLPVVLTAFSGKATAAGVTLSWATASEQHNDHFVVERAEGTPETFRALSLVKGAGTSTQQHQYQFVDAQATSLCYYRLRQIDLDGTENFSPVVAVRAELLSRSLLAYPSLATETLTVVGASSSHLGIFNQQGQQVQLADISASQTPQVDVRGLPGGVYFLRDAASGQSTRFVKSSGR